MIIKKDSLKPIDFSGLKIYDFTEGLELSSSFAMIQIPPNSQHSESWSTRSDKYYFVINGEIQFILEEKEFKLSKGDFCIVEKGQHFSYKNIQKKNANLILIHTPNFNINYEKFKE